jgi:hypothetical protein
MMFFSFNTMDTIYEYILDMSSYPKYPKSLELGVYSFRIRLSKCRAALTVAVSGDDLMSRARHNGQVAFFMEEQISKS